MGGRPDIIPPEWATELKQLQACARRVAFAPQSESRCSTAALSPCARAACTRAVHDGRPAALPTATLPL